MLHGSITVEANSVSLWFYGIESNQTNKTNKQTIANRTGRCAVIGCKLKQNANEGCNSCASLAGLVLSYIACFILLVIAPLRPIIESFKFYRRCDSGLKAQLKPSHNKA